MKFRVPALAAAVLAIALVLAVVLWAGALSNAVVVWRVDLGTISLLLGILSSGVITLAVFLAARARNRHRLLLQSAARDRRRFLARLDHELKNPLTAIRAGLANLGDSSSEALHEKALQSVNTQALRLSKLVSDLRKLAELETQPLEHSQVDLAGLLQEAVSLGREHPGADGLTLRLTLPQAPWPLPHIKGDWDLLFIVFHNLLDNAIKFSSSGKTVEIRAFEDGAQVVVEVADTGAGIPESELPYVWEELYRGEGAREIPGSGLGLALVRAIVERHGGRVMLRSRVGQGTVVSVRLPID